MRFHDCFGRSIEIKSKDLARILENRAAVLQAAAAHDPLLAVPVVVLKPVLESPDMVTQDREEDLRRHYYKRSWFMAPYERGYLKVTVTPHPILRLVPPLAKVVTGPLKVIDVAFVSTQSSKEKRLWPKPKPGHLPM